MPRSRSFKQPNAVYHLIPRFVAGEWFIRGPHERRQYLELFGRAIQKSDWRCLSYGIMSSHLHLQLIAGTVPLADWLAEPHSLFADWMNERNKRVGAVFVRGPKSLHVSPAGIGTVMAYIHRNPLRAGLVSNVRDTDWTSHRAYLGLDKAPPWLDVAAGLSLTGFESGEALDAWIQSTDIDRDAANGALVRARRGRPPKCSSDPLFLPDDE